MRQKETDIRRGRAVKDEKVQEKERVRETGVDENERGTERVKRRT